MPLCENDDIMVPISRGIFHESKNGKRVVYEVMFSCPYKDGHRPEACKNGCRSRGAMIEWNIKPENVDLWDLLFFGCILDMVPEDPLLSETYKDDARALFAQFDDEHLNDLGRYERDNIDWCVDVGIQERLERRDGYDKAQG